MARYFGNIGFSSTEETSPGIFEPVVVEKPHYGDVVRNTKRFEGEKINSDLSVSNSISVVADPYAQEHFFAIVYVEWAGRKWTVSDVDATTLPRLILRLGEVYNGPTA